MIATINAKRLLQKLEQISWEHSTTEEAIQKWIIYIGDMEEELKHTTNEQQYKRQLEEYKIKLYQQLYDLKYELQQQQHLPKEATSHIKKQKSRLKLLLDSTFRESKQGTSDTVQYEEEQEQDEKLEEDYDAQLTEDILKMTKDVKERATAIRDHLQSDDKHLLQKVETAVTKNLNQVQSQSTKLEERSKWFAKWSSLLSRWALLAVSLLVFLFMMILIKIFPK